MRYVLFAAVFFFGYLLGLLTASLMAAVYDKSDRDGDDE